MTISAWKASLYGLLLPCVLINLFLTRCIQSTKQSLFNSDKNLPWGTSVINPWRVCKHSLIMKCLKKGWCVGWSFEEKKWRLDGSWTPGKYYSHHRLHFRMFLMLSHDLEALTNDTEKGREGKRVRERLTLIFCWLLRQQTTKISHVTFYSEQATLYENSNYNRRWRLLHILNVSMNMDY